MIRFHQKAALALVGLLISGLAMADAKSDIAYRQGAFKVVGGHMSSMVAILRGQVRQENFTMHAQGMADIAKVIPTVFPEGSGEGKTEALAKIWTDQAGFKTAVNAFTTAANGVAEAAASGDMGATGAAFRKLSGSCKGCHDEYRAEHEH